MKRKVKTRNGHSLGTYCAMVIEATLSAQSRALLHSPSKFDGGFDSHGALISKVDKRTHAVIFYLFILLLPTLALAGCLVAYSASGGGFGGGGGGAGNWSGVVVKKADLVMEEAEVVVGLVILLVEATEVVGLEAMKFKSNTREVVALGVDGPMKVRREIIDGPVVTMEVMAVTIVAGLKEVERMLGLEEAE
ncbi:hypothetical protein BIW11_04399 [Tropilaelaps mercedesae]|uniref:Uncharacterized protein n=1 Tax=Tropilaelaps mercedesae TaxID=418985 RepID=A0A1V9X797_9ACAR|nr:hypothetical protein BIW11_04399 [Tropilaelaps mercedesae]